MHETVIARRIVDDAREHGEVLEIYLELGELGHVPPEELVECIRKLVPWKVHWTERPAEVICACGFAGHPTVLERGHDHFLIECPGCGETPDLLAGTDFVLCKVVVR
jgi:Zn finger protein HypA/HybF involved in hydrogenase expression